MEKQTRKKYQYFLAPDVAVIGGGPGGISAAIWCKRLGLNVLLLEKETRLGGQLHHIQNQIIDYPGLITQNGHELLTYFEHHLQQLDIEVLLNCTVTYIDELNQRIITSQGEICPRSIILATGSTNRRLYIPGEAEMLDRNEVYSTSGDVSIMADKNILIVGGGDRAFESACNLASTAQSIVLIHRSDHFRARPEFIEKAGSHQNIKIMPSTILERIYGHNKVEGVQVKNLSEDQEIQLSVDIVLIRIGVASDDTLAPQSLTRDMHGYIQIDSNGMTSLPWLFAIGDVVTPSIYTSISWATGQGMRAAKEIARQITQK